MDETAQQALAAQPDLGAVNTNAPGDVTPANAHEAARAAADALLAADEPQPAPTPPTPEPEAPAPEEPAGQPEAEPQAPLAPPAAPPAEAEPEEEDDEFSAPAPTQPTVPQLDSSKFVDENGYVDVKAMTDAFNQALAQAQQTASVTAQAEVNAQRFEEKQWQQAIDKYPQLKTDRALRDIVQSARIGKTTELYQRAGNDPEKLAAIKVPTPAQIAADLFKRFGEVKAQALREATETVRVQETQTHTETASTPGDVAGPAGKKADLFGQIRSADPLKANAAQRELLKELVFSED